MAKPRAIVTRRWPDACEKRLKELFDVTLNEADEPFTSDQLKSALQSCDVLMPTVTDKITADVLSVENRQANMIGNFGVGFNHIDIEKAKELGITVSNTPTVLTDCTADIAMSSPGIRIRAAGLLCGRLPRAAGTRPGPPVSCE